MNDTPASLSAGAVPEVIRGYFAAHDRRDPEAALATFIADAVVTDDGRLHRGTDQIRQWLAEASVEFTYTRTLTSAAQQDTDRWDIENRLEGNFPGGVVDLHYRFKLHGDLISDLRIEP